MVVDIANRYAAAGVPLVLDMLRSGQSDPLDNVLDRLRDRMGGGRPDAQEATES
jgi:hypothetical protein